MSLSDEVRIEYEKSQAVMAFEIEGEAILRIAFGSEANRMSLANCPECCSGIGSYHMLGCTLEQCPLCEGKAVNCACCYWMRPNEY